MSCPLRIAAAAAMFAALPLTAALASDRPPSQEEQAIIGDVLYSEGFNSWGKIEFDDDGVWEIDDAVDQDGNRRDIKLDQAFMVIDTDEDVDD